MHYLQLQLQVDPICKVQIAHSLPLSHGVFSRNPFFIHSIYLQVRNSTNSFPHREISLLYSITSLVQISVVTGENLYSPFSINCHILYICITRIIITTTTWYFDAKICRFKRRNFVLLLLHLK